MKFKFKKRDVKLKPNHQWRTPPGYKLIVMGRGAVHICFPRGWVDHATEHGSIRLHDAEPPGDSCRMEISFFIIDVGRAFYPFEHLVRNMGKAKTDIERLNPKEPVFSRRDGLRFGWMESNYHDPDNGRLVCSRSLLVYGHKVQALITYDCWADRVEEFEPVWNTLLKTMRLGQYVPDPSTGIIARPELN